MIKRKTIPFVGLMVIPTVIFPLSGCSSDSRINHVFDLTKNYFSKFERHELDQLTVHEAHDLYLTKLQLNPEIFPDDYFWSKCWVGSTFEPFHFWSQLIPDYDLSNDVEKEIIGPSKDVYQYDNQVISNLEVTTQDAKINDETWTFPTLSFSLDIVGKIKESYISEYLSQSSATGYVNGIVNCKIKFTNVPFRITVRTFKTKSYPYTTESFSFEPFGEWLIGDSLNVPSTRPLDWRIEVSITSSISGEVIFGEGLVQRIADDFDFNAVSNEENANWTYGSLSFLQTFCYLFTTSRYLSKISIK